MIVTKARAIMLVKRRKVSMYILPFPAVYMRILLLYTGAGQPSTSEKIMAGTDYLWVLDEEATSLLAARCEAALSEIMSGQARCRPLG
jgi:hypothetical protein